MKPIDLLLPPKSEVYNFLYRTDDPSYLVQDILSVALTSGYVIEAGWFPEHDVNGTYLIRAMDACDGVLFEYSDRDIDNVKGVVESLASQLSQDSFNLSNCNSNCGPGSEAPLYV